MYFLRWNRPLIRVVWVHTKVRLHPRLENRHLELKVGTLKETLPLGGLADNPKPLFLLAVLPLLIYPIRAESWLQSGRYPQRLLQRR